VVVKLYRKFVYKQTTLVQQLVDTFTQTQTITLGF